MTAGRCSLCRCDQAQRRTHRPAAGGPSSCRWAGTSPRSSASGSTPRCTRMAPPTQAVMLRQTPRRLRHRLQAVDAPAAGAAAGRAAAAAAGGVNGRGSRTQQPRASLQPQQAAVTRLPAVTHLRLSRRQACSCCGRRAPGGGAATRSSSSSWPWRCDFLLPQQHPTDSAMRALPDFPARSPSLVLGTRDCTWHSYSPACPETMLPPPIMQGRAIAACCSHMIAEAIALKSCQCQCTAATCCAVLRLLGHAADDGDGGCERGAGQGRSRGRCEAALPGGRQPQSGAPP